MPETGAIPPITVGGAPPLTQSAAQATQGAAQESVYNAVANPTPTAQSFVGGLQGASQTIPGAVVVTGANAGFSAGLGTFADLPEMMPTMFGTLFLYQGVKHIPFLNQDKAKWLLLPLLAAIVAFVIVYFGSHGDVWEAAAHCLKTCWVSGYQAMLQFHLGKPFGMLSSASDPSDS